MAIHHDKLAYGKLASLNEGVSEDRLNNMLDLLNAESGEICDIHVHTCFSSDSKEDPEKYILKAIELNQNYLGFSDHYDYDYVLWNIPAKMPALDLREHTLSQLKKKYADQITILNGLEVGYSKEAEPHYKKLIKNGNFDYIINSVHGLKDRGDCYFAEFFKGKSKEQAYSDYLNAVYSSVIADFDYNVIGHIGYVARNAPYKPQELFYSEFAEIIDKILKAIIERDVCLEINGAVGNNSAKFTPDTDILERYIKLGGKNFTYGSDSHRVDSYFRKGEEVKNFLKSHQIYGTYVFEKGKKIFVEF
ncbi:MAG: histidinol-phosphatase HisJ family protein [Clostridia bacterium]|nr:histidinol-phosphatase HisJ family protein [Clostridia bacterium]